MTCDQAGVSSCAPKEHFTVPLLGTGNALGIAATSGPERVANASEMHLTPNPRWCAVHIGNNSFPCPCGVISEHSVCATPRSPAGRQHEVEKGQTPAQGMNQVATVTAALPLLVQLCMR